MGRVALALLVCFLCTPIISFQTSNYFILEKGNTRNVSVADMFPSKTLFSCISDCMILGKSSSGGYTKQKLCTCFRNSSGFEISREMYFQIYFLSLQTRKEFLTTDREQLCNPCKKTSFPILSGDRKSLYLYNRSSVCVNVLHLGIFDVYVHGTELFQTFKGSRSVR